MKKNLLLITMTILILSEPLHAQLEAGKIMVGVASTFNMDIFNSDLMNMSFTSSNVKYPTYTSETEKMFNINAIPRGGYFLVNNLAAGMDIYLSHSKMDYDYGIEEKTTQVCFNPFVRYYYPLLWSYPFIEVSGGIGTEKRTGGGTSGDIEDKYSIRTLSGVAGIAKPVGNRATFDIMVGYSRRVSIHETEQKNSYGSFILRMGFVVFFLQQEPEY
jgi:hypothetical protein